MQLHAPARRSFSVALAWRPEWPVVLLVGFVWLGMAHALLGAHAGHHAAGGTSTASALAAWGFMSFAMMVPTTLPAIRHVGLNSIRSRRHWATAVYVVSYLGVWLVFGVVAVGLVAVADAMEIHRHRLIAFTLALATGWQLTRIKRRALMACRRTVPLPPAGWRADLGCARFGVLQGWRCVLACWPLMFLMALVEHHLGLMLVLTLGVLAEERAPRRERLIVPIAVLLGIATVAAATFG